LYKRKSRKVSKEVEGVQLEAMSATSGKEF
jgi:hypothetical protein